MSLSAAILWIRVLSASLVLFGLIVAAAAHPASAGLADFLLDLLKWPPDGADAFGSPEGRFIAGVGGGVMAGWGAMMMMLASQLLPGNPAGGRKVLIAGLLVWFAIDSTATWIAGVPLNLPGNALYLAAFLFPLLRMKTS